MHTKGARTRQRIIDRALQLFSVRGYHNTSISDILLAAELTKGGLYGHFRSKEEIWYAVYDQAVEIWRGVVFHGLRDVPDPLTRVRCAVTHHLRAYLGADVFDGGCFFVNMLVELSGQSPAMSRHLLKGFVAFSKLLQRWLQESVERGDLRPDADLRDIADYLVIALNGAATIYSASRDRTLLDRTQRQLTVYLSHFEVAAG